MRRIASVSDFGAFAPARSAAEPAFRQLVEELAETLEAGGIDDAKSLARDIVTTLLDKPRSWAITHGEFPIDAQVVIPARSAAHRIVSGAPFAYAVGRTTFRHLDLRIDARVLIPRPETEVLVEEILSRFRSISPGVGDWGVAVDIGTGSGAIALSLAAEGRFGRVIATDASLDALDVARWNAGLSASRLNCPVEFRSGSMLAPVRNVSARLLVSNPPYVAFDEIDDLPPSVRDWEPPDALLSGSSGLAATAAIVQEGGSLLESGGILALEVDERRASLVAEMVMSAGGYIDVRVLLDLTGRERFVFASRA